MWLVLAFVLIAAGALIYEGVTAASRELDDLIDEPRD